MEEAIFMKTADSNEVRMVSGDSPDEAGGNIARSSGSVYDGTKLPPMCSTACMLDWYKFGYPLWCKMGQAFALYDILAAKAVYDALSAEMA
jgi:hypothetical protein